MNQPWPYGSRPAHVPPDSRPKPWEGPPVTPVPAAYGRLVAEFPADRTGHTAVLFAVLELHQPGPHWVGTGGYVPWWECYGCEFSGGGDGEPPEWPCQTTLLIAQHLGVVMAP